MPLRLYHRVSLFCSSTAVLALDVWGRSVPPAPLPSHWDRCGEEFGCVAGPKGLWHVQVSVPATTTR